MAAPARSPRCQKDAHRVAARLTYLPRVNPLPPPDWPVLIVPRGAGDRALGADADVLYICAHSYPGPRPEGFLDTDLAALHAQATGSQKATITPPWRCSPPSSTNCAQRL